MLQRWFSPRALLFHLLLAILVPGCLVAAWWQATRAASGNLLSWAYSVEWPIFAVIAVVGWWQLIHEDPAEVAARRAARRGGVDEGPATAVAELAAGAGAAPGAADPCATGEQRADTPAGALSPLEEVRAEASLAAYNDYLAGLTDSRRRRRPARGGRAAAGA